MTNDRLLGSLPQEIGARFTVPNSVWMTDQALRSEIERRGFFAIEITPSAVTLRRDLYNLGVQSSHKCR